MTLVHRVSCVITVLREVAIGFALSTWTVIMWISAKFRKLYLWRWPGARETTLR